MNSKGKQGHEESSPSPGHVYVQESEDNTILPTSGSDNLELGTEALTLVVRKVLEKVFDARIRRTRLDGPFKVLCGVFWLDKLNQLLWGVIGEQRGVLAGWVPFRILTLDSVYLGLG
ncbi:hypothetical protein J1N35_014852 [Gossypium stocksii]|uniref:Uncharacterized protein n=1 Tax=Gossypium stocksii TaxID=47602 RepID=A0A9D3VWX0_9ROSI|nr:hypothetical protein J1N35_014852 [Gossypium stocksii]